MFEKSVSNGLHRASYGTLSLIAVLFSLLLIISGCGEEDDGGRGGNVTLSFTVPSAPPSGGAASKAVTPSGIGSISIAISGAGMTTITDTFNVSAGGTVTRSYTIPSGSSRTVTAKAYSGAMASGALLYQGSATFDLASGSAKTVAITMSSLFSLWAKTYGGTSDEVASSIQQTSDGGYIVAGWTASFGAGFRDSWILKLNADGTVAWQKTFGGIGIFDEVSSIQQTSDGGWIAAGVTDSSGAALTDIWIVKLFPDGTVDWQKRYGGSSREDVDVAIQQTADGGYIVGGHTQSFGRVFDDFWILKLDPIGNVTWQKTYGGTEDDRVTSIQQTTPDGGYIVAGWTKSFGAGPLGASDFWVLKLDRFGGVTWNQTYGGTGFEQPASIQQTADGGYIVAGYTSSFGAGFYDFWIVKLDNSGLVTWEKTYG
ncbi:MAG: hypothetical protein ACE5GF_09115, partial [Thermodesulfobacteriota bacterium]